METRLENIKPSGYSVARGVGILDTIPATMEGLSNVKAIPEWKKISSASFLRDIQENPELAYEKGYATKALDIMLLAGTYMAAKTRSDEVFDGIKKNKLTREILYGGKK